MLGLNGVSMGVGWGGVTESGGCGVPLGNGVEGPLGAVVSHWGGGTPGCCGVPLGNGVKRFLVSGLLGKGTFGPRSLWVPMGVRRRAVGSHGGGVKGGHWGSIEWEEGSIGSRGEERRGALGLTVSHRGFGAPKGNGEKGCWGPGLRCPMEEWGGGGSGLTAVSQWGEGVLGLIAVSQRGMG